MTMHRILSPPIDCHWMGWRSTTVELANMGWQFSAREEIRENRLMLAIHHPEGRVHGISEFHDYNYMQRYSEFQQQRMVSMNQIPLHFSFTLANHITLNYMHNRLRGVRLEPINPYPTVETSEVVNLNQLAIFRPLPPSDRDVVVVAPTFDEILDMALEHQAPKQKELREKARRQGRGLIISRAA